MPVWPSSLPVKAIAGTHVMRHKANAVQFDPDVGEPIRRPRYQGSSTTETFDLILTNAQRQTLDDFWRFDCAQGTLTFYAALIDGALRSWWFDSQQPPTASNIRGGTAYRVSLVMGCRR